MIIPTFFRNESSSAEKTNVSILILSGSFNNGKNPVDQTENKERKQDISKCQVLHSSTLSVENSLFPFKRRTEVRIKGQ